MTLFTFSNKVEVTWIGHPYIMPTLTLKCGQILEEGMFTKIFLSILDFKNIFRGQYDILYAELGPVRL